MSDVGDSRLPVTLLTGFLGSGKTTTLNRLLELPELADTAVIINEFGEVGIDHLLVEQVSENLRLLQSGCLCCTVRGDLVDTLVDLYERRESEELSPFTRVVIETTGLADPVPVLQTFMIDPQVMQRYRLEQVVTTVDAVNGASTLDRHVEAVTQISLADRLLLTKTDLASDQTIAKLEARLRELNPAAGFKRVLNGRVSAVDVLGDGHHGVLDIDAYMKEAESRGSENSYHDGKVKSHCLILDQPVEQERLAYWLELIASMRGEHLLRVKGIVQVVEHPDQPMIVHGVQQVFHPLKPLAKWPSTDHRTRIVFIVQGIEYAEITRTFERFVGMSLPMFKPTSRVMPSR
ncbi:CobW family GTP-binding protein [Pseudomonas citri]|uniref:CobW family GTP-binding protein n=1 Tax=Pseudomonas citri TaxID=2978349 RepID=UPI0021B6E01C|nr:GTP-binding protein [Pseudomonas citri]